MTAPDCFTSELALPYSALNTNGRIKADWLLNLFQDAASHQCHGLGISGFDMAQKGFKWVVSQYDIHIHSHPSWLSNLNLSTWRSPWKNLYEVRRFIIAKKDGQPLISATGIWILIKAVNGKPVRLSPHLPDHLMQPPAEPPELFRVSTPLTEYHHEFPIRVRFLDLDLNQHVNNREYLRWAVESLPEPHCFSYTPVRCKIAYLKEGLFGQDLVSRVRLEFTPTGLDTEHAIVHPEKDIELARISISWSPLTETDP
ncbi:MAG TPA: hypothetical protein DHV36_15815 [Desulfobacteraceae bacterium]|nr:hypothetical protein [Desulfobacteraceae bacterium]|tara:strand:- start:343 stop:1110 length:768 start_codon:yes stop_codon:yes gene_type:complete